MVCTYADLVLVSPSSPRPLATSWSRPLPLPLPLPQEEVDEAEQTVNALNSQQAEQSEIAVKTTQVHKFVLGCCCCLLLLLLSLVPAAAWLLALMPVSLRWITWNRTTIVNSDVVLAPSGKSVCSSQNLLTACPEPWRVRRKPAWSVRHRHRHLKRKTVCGEACSDTTAHVAERGHFC